MARTKIYLRLPAAAAAPPLGLTQASKACISALRAYVPRGMEIGLQPRKGMSLTFADFVLAGAVPPYSAFLLVVLRYYGIQLAHLTPNSILLLSVFAYLCVKWLEVPPSLGLFRQFFICRWIPPCAKMAVGSCYLKTRSSVTEFIQMPCAKNYLGWRGRWIYIQDSSRIHETAVPAAAPIKRPSWDEEGPDNDHLHSLRKRVAELKRRGLTGAMVMLDALKHRLAPLRKDMEIFPAEANLLDQTHIMRSLRKHFGAKVAKMAMGEEEGQEGGDEEDSYGDQVDGSEAVDDYEGMGGNARSPQGRRQRTTGCLRFHPPAHPFRRGEEHYDEEDDSVDEEDDGDEDYIAESSAARHLLLPQSMVGTKRQLTTTVVGKKPYKLCKIQEAGNANRVKVQQKMSSDETETEKLAHLTTQDNREAMKLEMKRLKMESKKLEMEGKKIEKEAKMMDTYNNLISQDTSSMTDDEKSEHLAAMRCLRKKLFPEII